ncbi:cytochrome d ubiquinol oxidase subunit II [Mariniblastus fucicola]|uniref:Cytochrome bd-I ubiquinol oxidase subunit 2 n=1 Tax=Mariniblastus fucicola TaxID=980251 RepID=A0A5B9PBT1_9BACT|nr:cytochrome d ubiquinol oxidase subunit II [Mariniblastus fucicola]QEG23724.1 Cytochrome bd-I ubiquinol oxidase subunit 2 [Mariniblastus fucicola]
MDLNLIWFILLGVLLAGYAILDGFDLGVGIIHPILGGEKERGLAIKAIGPLWDGNEVWLVTFGGALFAAFPEAYATILSAMYLPIMLLLFCLILRAVSIDFYSKVESRFWKLFWDCGFTISSLGATIVFGVAAGNLIQGFPIDERGTYTGDLIGLFTPYTLATGFLATTVFAMHGAMFLFLKTTGDVRERLKGWLWHTWGVFLIAYILVSMMTLIENEHVVDNIKQAPWAIPIVILNVLCVANIPRAIMAEKYAQAFASSSINIACLVGLYSVSTFPNMVYSTSESTSLDIYNAASSQGTLWLMCIIAMIGVPLIASYTAIVYWTFRHPVTES